MKILIISDSLVHTPENAQKIANIISMLYALDEHFTLEVIIPSNEKNKGKLFLNTIQCNTVHVLEFNSCLISLQEYCHAILQVIPEIMPQYIFLASSIVGRSISAWLGAKTGSGVVADALDIRYHKSKKQFIFSRTTTHDNLLSDIICTSDMKIASLQIPRCNSGLNPIGKDSRKVLIHRTDTFISGITVLSREQHTLNLKNSIIFGIGGGVSPKAFTEIEKFAQRYNIQIVGSRKAVEAGHVSAMWQVGQSGNIISVPVYVAIGISGAIQHIVGINHCNKIIAINTDSNAPICEWSDYCFIVDCFEFFLMLNQLVVQ